MYPTNTTRFTWFMGKLKTLPFFTLPVTKRLDVLT
jgi:hypothetical protein